ncbi:hypothetical protein WMY93_010123 [Mugilogobius chulae]|uniref:E3 ubiquitin-protein ligase n=1 Tax=Mugilogobius chulae TaxID=88201 RepID=A0AAW0PA42_9GOBI
MERGRGGRRRERKEERGKGGEREIKGMMEREEKVMKGEREEGKEKGNIPYNIGSKRFPYAAPPPHEPVKTLRSLINIRKDTLRLVSRACYNVEFTFDSDTQVAITIYYQATEEFHNGVPLYLPQDPSLQSETVHFKRGVSQQFSLPSHSVFPMVVQAVVDEGEEHMGHSHILLATFEKHTDGSYCVKPLKQKQVVDGVSYLLQEIYGIENKYNSQESKVSEDEISDNSAECVVCLSDVRDTLILPCRHLCLCNACADTLRYQANCCPICRLPFRALLQIRAMRKKLSPVTPTSFNAVITSQTSDSEDTSASEHIPPGYEAVSLLEALNGPLSSSSGAPGLCGTSQTPAALPPYNSEAPVGSARSHSPPDHSASSQGSKLKKSASKSLSQNSSVLHEEDEKSSESENGAHKTAASQRENGATPDSENVTLSSSGAIDQSSCTGTPLSSTITSPEEPVSCSLAQSVMSMASSHSQHSHISTDTLSSMSGSYLAGPDPEAVLLDEGPEELQDAPMESERGPSQQEEDFPVEPEQNYSLAVVEEQDSEGNDVTEEDCSSNSNGKGGRSRCAELANNNQGCDTPSLGLDNEQAQADTRFADLLYLGGYRAEPTTHSSNSNLNLEDPGPDQNQDYRETQSPRPRPRGPLFF